MTTDSIAKQNNEVTANSIQSLIVRLPGRPAAMLDRDLADIYETETKYINQAVKRNLERFPSDFMFQATEIEMEHLRSQIVTTNMSRSNSYLFTREGANMLSAVLQSDIAVQRSIQIMRAFTQLEQSLYNLPAERKEAFELQMLGLKYCSEMLHYSEVSKLQLIHAAHEYHGVPTAILPVYVKDVRVTFSAKDLLIKNKLPLSSAAFNKLLIAEGFLEERERLSTKGDRIKKFKVLNEKGLQYGQNDSSRHSPRETQPHYYEDTFMELYNLINK